MKKLLLAISILTITSSLFIPVNNNDVNALGDYSTWYAGHKYVQKHGISYKYINEYTATSEWPSVAFLSQSEVVRCDGAEEYRSSRMGYWVKAELRVNGKGAKYYH